MQNDIRRSKKTLTSMRRPKSQSNQKSNVVCMWVGCVTIRPVVLFEPMKKIRWNVSEWPDVE
jgi:hypothetical protein